MQAVSFMQLSVQKLFEPASGVMHVVHARPASQRWPHAIEKVLHVPAWQVTPAAVAPKRTTEPSSVPGGPAAQPQPG